MVKANLYNHFMKPFLDRFILGFPVLFLKQYPYAWIAFVALWPRSPSIAVVFLAVVVIGILSLRWQAAAWVSQMRTEHAGVDGKFYVDRPPLPWQMVVRNVALLLLGGAAFAFLLQDRLGLTFWQLYIMVVGFALFYQDNRFFGAEVTYIVVAEGIAIRFVPGHLEYRLFLQFKEISRIEKAMYQESREVDLIARTRQGCDGLLLTPRDPRGFTRQIDKLFIVPGDVEKFVEQLPFGFGNSGS
ncbi:MAG: hypothetical protein ACM3XO_02170 [Bacteroidota bacterium]